MAIRLSGMQSGMDTDSIVKELVKAKQTEVDNITKKKTKLEWKKESWGTMNTAIYKFYTGPLSKIKTKGSYSAKKVVQPEVKSATAKASNNAAAGVYSYRVNQLAQASAITGAQMGTYTSTNDITSSTKLLDAVGMSVLSGQTITFNYTGEEPVKDENGEQLYYVQTTAADGTISVDKTQTFSKDHTVGDNQKLVAATSTQTINATYTFATDSTVDDINKFLENKNISGIKASVSEGKISFVNTKGTTIGVDEKPVGNATATISGTALATLGFGSNSFDINFSAKIKVDKDGNQVNDANGNPVYEATGGSQSALTEIQYKKPDDTMSSKTKISDIYSFPGGAAQEISLGNNYENKVTINVTDTMDDVVNKFKAAGVNAAFDEQNQRFYLTAKESGEKKDINLSGNTDLLNALGLGSGATKVDGQDSEMVLNNVPYTNSTNEVKFEGLGLTFNLEEVTESGKTEKITVQNDVDSVYKVVKDFVTSYNELLTKMSEGYYADKCSYEPLTDEEADALTDSQVNKWEEKIKASLFRRDSTLGSLMSSMREAFSGSVEIDGKKYGLSSFGICTGDYTERGLLHIYGDEDDTYASQENKLKKALEEDPDKVMQVLSGLGQKLYDTLSKKMSSSSLSSALTLYNDKEMKRQIEDYEDKIKEMQEKVDELEDRYYKQFSSMESALAKLQSSQSAVSSMLGS